MDFFDFNGSGDKTIEDHVCEITVVDFKLKKSIFSCKAVNGKISSKDVKGLKKAQEQIKDQSKKAVKIA